MVYSPPTHSRSRVDRAGKNLATDAATADDLDVINDWRSGHALPLNTVYMTLKRKAQNTDPQALVSQRIKRLSSIDTKLRRFHGMKLSRMQDLGGCRAVGRDARSIDEVRSKYAGTSTPSHLLSHEYDYITEPKPDGYRGIHLIFSYVGGAGDAYHGLQIEMQLRSRLQHAWATAVETVDTLFHQGIKVGGGKETWRRFFALMGSAHAHREGTPLVPGTPPSRFELVNELRESATRLDVVNRLAAVNAAFREVDRQDVRDAKYFLLHLSPVAETVRVVGFRRDDLEDATKAYLEMEKTGADAVLVSVESVDALRQAYPNYFLDTQVFLDSLADAT